MIQLQLVFLPLLNLTLENSWCFIISKNTKIGVVVIGRNEGERLKKSLNSIINKVQSIVYVDSGSTDGSQEMARNLGVEVVELDMSTPFTAARARNEGFFHLLECDNEIQYVQFVDGDCEVMDGWLKSAFSTLENESRIAVVCGCRRERYPENSVYNQLCDIEWNTPIGEAKACGGDFLIRSSVFQQVDGFNASLIAGEEPEMCVRIRQNGWKIWRIDKDMTFHDAKIFKFSQWWMRNVRAGHAFAEGAFIHGEWPERHNIVESRRIWLWALVIPVFILVLFFFSSIFLLLFLIYPFQIIRIAVKSKLSKKLSLYYAFFVVLGKFPELQGQIKFIFNKLLKSRNEIIEYK